MGHLRTIDFQRAPNVSITRIHGMAPTASLADAPSGFTGGCHPSSTQYCRANAGTPVSVQAATPVYSAPVSAAPIVSAPVVAAPVQTLRSWTGQGYNPSNFQSRQYGDTAFTPGIAHIPTSIVDRSPVNAQTILNSGRTVPQPIASASSFSGSSFVTLPGTMSQSFSSTARSYAPQPSAPVSVGNGTFASNVAPDGTYWEKTSGVTTFGNTVATQVICKRQLPRQTVNPVVNIPVPVPTAVPVSVPTCSTVGGVHRPHAGPHNLNAGRYGATQGSPWVY